MKKIIYPLLSLAFALGLQAQPKPADGITTVARERVQASYLLAFGRTATNDEVKYWAPQNLKSVSELVARHRDYLTRDAGTRTASIKRSYVDALGRNPDAAEINHWAKGGDLYADLMKKHIDWLRANAAESEKVVKRSYQFVFNRAPTAAELGYWKSQGTLSYAILVSSHQDWKSRNGAAVPHTSGAATVAANPGFLATFAVSPAVAAETRTAAGLAAPRAGGIVAAGAGNIVAAGAGNIVAAGAGNIVAAGAGNLVAAGGGN